MDAQALSVVVVDDDDVDMESVRREIRKRQFECDLHFAHDGAAALDILRREDFRQSLERCLVLLDLNMPGMTGLEFLQELRKDQALRRTLVFVLTTSDHFADKCTAYDYNVCGYFRKADLKQAMDALQNYAAAVRYPPQSE